MRQEFCLTNGRGSTCPSELLLTGRACSTVWPKTQACLRIEGTALTVASLRERCSAGVGRDTKRSGVCLNHTFPCLCDRDVSDLEGGYRFPGPFIVCSWYGDRSVSKVHKTFSNSCVVPVWIEGSILSSLSTFLIKCSYISRLHRPCTALVSLSPFSKKETQNDQV